MTFNVNLITFFLTATLDHATPTSSSSDHATPTASSSDHTTPTPPCPDHITPTASSPEKRMAKGIYVLCGFSGGIALIIFIALICIIYMYLNKIGEHQIKYILSLYNILYKIIFTGS